MSKQPSNKPNNSLFAPLGVGFFIGVITIGTIVLVWNRDREPRHYLSVHSDARRDATPNIRPDIDSATFSGFNATASAVLDPAVARVAARFACSCGTCGEKRLDICSCETAQTERAFIQEQLRNGRSEAEAADAVNKKYGGLKS